MEELMIQAHSFEDAKEQLKKFSEQTTTDLNLQKVDTSKSFGEFLFGGGLDFDHKVTGAELNSLTTQIQNNLMDINKLQRDIIGEFGQVYNALEALDNEYIQGILTAIKSAQKANEEVKTAQGDIEKTIAVQKKTIKVLEQFKVKMDKYNIDKMWHDINELWNLTEMLDKKMDLTEERITQQAETNIAFSELMNSINKHIEDIDVMYDDYKSLKNDIATMNDAIHKQENIISNLKDSLLDEQSKSEEVEKKLSKKIKIAYLMTGGTVGLMMIEFILIVMRFK